MRIAVIVPVYKVERWLGRCVESILAQTFSDFELILIDDGSPDRCGEMCDAYARKDKRVRVVHQENRGLSAARNAGLDLIFADSDSEYVTFIDSDDWVEPNYLGELIKGLEFGVEIVSFDLTEVFADGMRYSRYPDEGWKVVSPDDYWVADRVNYVRAACGKLYKKRLFEKVRYPLGKFAEDAFTMHFLLFQVDRLAVRAFPAYNYFQGCESITRCKWSERKLDAIEAYECACLFFHEYGYRKAETASRIRKWSVMADSIAHLEECDRKKAAEFRAVLRQAIERGEVPIWEGRGVYRCLTPRSYVLRWFCGMLYDAISKGRRSWLAREAPRIAKSVVRRRLRLLFGKFDRGKVPER